MNCKRAAIVASIVSVALPILVATPVAAAGSGFGRLHATTAAGVTISAAQARQVTRSGQAPPGARLAPDGGTPSPATGTFGPSSSDPRIQLPSNPANEDQIVKAFTAYSAAEGPPGVPPDVAVATNGTQTVQVNNFFLRVFNRAGTKLVEVATSAFFLQDSKFSVADPQVVYDPASARWFLSAMEFNGTATGGKVLLLVSPGPTIAADAPAGWDRYVLVDTSSTLDDQPKLGVTSDKVLVAFERFSGGNTFAGPEAVIADKAEAVAFAGSLDEVFSFGGSNDAGMAPANNLSSGSTGYFVETGNPGSLLLTILTVTGRPGDSSTLVSPTQQTLSVATASPPDADQKSCTACIQTSDTRVQNAVWSNGVLTFVAGQGCLPYGSSGTTPTACVRLWRVNTPSLSIAEDSTYSTNGEFVFDPAITYSKNGDSHLVASASTTGLMGPSMLVVSRQAGSGSWGTPNLITVENIHDYVGSDSSPYRWGDYSSIVPDPNNPTDAIAAAETVDGSTVQAPNYKIVVAQIGMPVDAVTLARSATAIVYGGTVTISGKLTRPGGQPIVNESLQLWRKLAPATSFTEVNALPTNSAGVASFVDKPTANAQYYVKYPGRNTTDGVDTTTEFALATQSGTVSEPVTVKVAASANHSLIAHGASVKLTFVVTPNERGKTVYLQRYISGRWRNVTSHALSSASAWTFTEVLSTAGTYYFRGYEAGDATHAAGASPTLRIRAT